MQVYKEDSNIEDALQQVEALMQKLGMTMDFGGRVCIFHGDKSGYLMDSENREETYTLPRSFESERIALFE